MTLIFLTLSVILNTGSIMFLTRATWNNTRAIRNLMR